MTVYEEAKKFLAANPQVDIIPLVNKIPAPGVMLTRPRPIDAYDWDGITSYGVIPRGLTVVDIDSAKAGQEFTDLYGDPPETFMVKTPNGVHMYFKGESSSRNGMMSNIDIRSTSANNYIVGPGSVISTGDYRVVSDCKIADLPEAYLEAINTPKAPLSVALEGGSFQEIANSTGYNNALISLKGKLIKLGIDEPIANEMVIAANSKLENPYPMDKLQGTVLARKDYPLGSFDIGQIRPEGGRITTWEDRRKRPPISWLVDEIIPEHGIGQMWAATGVGKSFAAIDLSLSICNGADSWIGRKITTSGDVLYILSEGSLGFQKRIDTWTSRFGGNDKRLYDLNAEEFFVNMASDDGLAEVAADIEDIEIQENLKLIVVDTQGQLLSSLDENSNSEFNSVASRLKRLSKRFNCAILLIHHSGHDGSRARGAAAMKQAMDFEISLTKKDGQKVLKLNKVKEAQIGLKGMFDLTPRNDSVFFDYHGSPEKKALSDIKAVSNLADPQTVAKAMYANGASFEEISKIVGVDASTLKMNMEG